MSMWEAVSSLAFPIRASVIMGHAKGSIPPRCTRQYEPLGSGSGATASISSVDAGETFETCYASTPSNGFS